MIIVNQIDTIHEHTKCSKCSKCAGKTFFRKIKTKQGEFKTILQCSICNFYYVYSPCEE